MEQNGVVTEIEVDKEDMLMGDSDKIADNVGKLLKKLQKDQKGLPYGK